MDELKKSEALAVLCEVKDRVLVGGMGADELERDFALCLYGNLPLRRTDHCEGEAVWSEWELFHGADEQSLIDDGWRQVPHYIRSHEGLAALFEDVDRCFGADQPVSLRRSECADYWIAAIGDGDSCERAGVTRNAAIMAAMLAFKSSLILAGIDTPLPSIDGRVSREEAGSTFAVA